MFGAVNAASTKTPFTFTLKIDTPAPENCELIQFAVLIWEVFIVCPITV